MLRLVSLLAALLLPIAVAVAHEPADNAWVVAAKARSPGDISLWTRMVSGAQLKAFRGATHAQVPLESAVAFLYDMNAMPDWVFRCKEARILAESPDGTAFIYMQVNGIWPLEDRDAIVKVTPSFNAATGELEMIGIAAPDYMPPQPGYIRIPSIESSWRMRPVDDGLLRIEWSGHVDPAGNVPRWLANSLVTIVPRYTLKHMRELVVDPKWQTAAQRQVGERLIERARLHPSTPER